MIQKQLVIETIDSGEDPNEITNFLEMYVLSATFTHIESEPQIITKKKKACIFSLIIMI